MEVVDYGCSDKSLATGLGEKTSIHVAIESIHDLRKQQNHLFILHMASLRI